MPIYELVVRNARTEHHKCRRDFDLMAKRKAQKAPKTTAIKAAAVREPAQARSRASMESLLDIGRRLIEERGIDDCSMTDVAAAAGSSIGSLYFRFGNRERFVSEVMQRQIDAAKTDFERVRSNQIAAANSPTEAILAAVKWFVGSFAQNRGLLRAQLRRTLESPDVWRPFQDFARHIVDTLIEDLEAYPEIQRDPEWRFHLRVAMQMLLGTLNNILINEPGPLDLADPRAAEEFGLAVLRYLRLQE